MKKRHTTDMDEGGDGNMGDQAHVISASLTATQVNQVDEAATKKVLSKMKELL